MGWSVSPISLFVLGSGTVAIIVGLYALRKRPDPMAYPLTVLMVAVAAWAIPHGISMGYTDVDAVLFWNKVQFLGVGVTPVAYLVVALRYAVYERFLSWRVYALLGIVPAVTAVAVWRYPATSLYWDSTDVETVAGTTVLVAEYGPWYWLNLGYLYLVTALTLFLLASVVIRAGPVHRIQSSLLFAAGFVPLAANIAFNVGISPFPLVDFTTAALTVSGLAFAVTLFRYDLLDLSPAAYQSVPDLLGDGIIVFDREHRLIESNHHAEVVLDTSLTVGTSAAELFEAPLEDLDGTVIERTVGSPQFYNVRHSTLRDYRGTVVGHAVVMREITALKEHEQRLNVTNRILRHNLRNELNVILGQIAVLEQRHHDTDELETMRRAANRLMSVAEKSRTIQTSLRGNREQTTVDVVSLAESVAERHRDRHHQATIRTVTSGSAPALTTGHTALETVLDNLIENALEHNDSDHPAVDLCVDVECGDVLVRVKDNGPGIPEAEQTALRRGHETQLEHGSGLGLWLVYWLVSGMGGDIEFEANEPRGTVVCLRLIRADGAVERDEPTAL